MSRALKPALWFLVALSAVYGLTVWTAIGQSAENTLMASQAHPARTFVWSRSMGLPPLRWGSVTLAMGVILIAVVALMRRRRREGIAGVGIAVVTVTTAEVLHAALPRPGLVDSPQWLTSASFPSGTVAITAGLALGAVVVCSPRTRPYAAAVGALWLAITAAAVQALSWHRPSDVLGTTLLACACHAVAMRLLGPAATGGTRRIRAVPPLALAAAGALLASGRGDSVERTLVFAGVAFVCSTLLWTTATGRRFGLRRASSASSPGHSRTSVGTVRNEGPF